MEAKSQQTPSKHSLKIILAAAFLVWSFGWVIAPILRSNIPIYNEILQVADERDIDTSAYMYEENAGSYDAEYYLRDSFEHSGRSDYGATKFFIAGVISCIIILGIGWRYIM